MILNVRKKCRERGQFDRVAEKSECKTKNGEKNLGDSETVEECTNKCYNDDKCKFFAFGRKDGSKPKLCFHEVIEEDKDCNVAKDKRLWFCS